MYESDKQIVSCATGPPALPAASSTLSTLNPGVGVAVKCRGQVFRKDSRIYRVPKSASSSGRGISQILRGNPLHEQNKTPCDSSPRNWPTDTIVATCNPDDDNNYGHAMIYSVSGFAARTDEHCSDLLDHTIPHSVSDSRRTTASQQA